jgi:RNA polymerase sigma-70 factor, ECF subfamily
MCFQAMADLRDKLASEIPRLRRFARGLVRDRDIADDLVQDTLVRALAAERRFREGNLGIWLIVILINLNRNRLRGLARRGPHVDLDKIEYGMGTQPGEGLDIVQAVQRLSDDQREVLLLIGLEGLSYADCAEALAIPLGTVMSRLSRAREALRVLLDQPKRGNEPHLRVIK